MVLCIIIISAEIQNLDGLLRAWFHMARQLCCIFHYFFNLYFYFNEKKNVQIVMDISGRNDCFGSFEVINGEELSANLQLIDYDLNI
ncbi:hypothetical protein EAY64_18320 [Aquitalea palustris]|uniref:Uncharacterized protein n=1 Tax=Aquitalea palustris TaxID=2480983 RepID=A0A454JDU2_9NEIS|nr:hypothetical protein EAY64_18320 [Aquitalea palustris]